MTWMDLEDTMLSETRQSHMDKYCTIPLQEVSQIVKPIEAENRTVVTRGWGQKKM